MNRVYKTIKWCLLLNKRLFKKWSFLLVLLMVPCLVAGMWFASGQDSGVVQIVLYGEGEDAATSYVLENLTEQDSVVQYRIAESEEEAIEAVEQGEADAAWIFAENLEESIAEAIEYQDTDGIVTIVQREDTMQLRLARMKLYAAVYPKYLYAVHEDFMENHLGATNLSDEEMEHYFSDVSVRNDLFRMSYMNKEDAVEEGNYLLAPLRGILALWLMLAGFAAVMYFMQDKLAGLFDRVQVERRSGLACGYQWIVVLDAAMIMLLSLKLTGTFVSLKRELLCLLLFLPAAVGFCNLMRVLCGKMERLGALIPILMIGMLVLCPVFLDFKKYRVMQLLFPPYYYLKSIHSDRYLLDIVIYAVVVWVLGFLIEKIAMQRRK